MAGAIRFLAQVSVTIIQNMLGLADKNIIVLIVQHIPSFLILLFLFYVLEAEVWVTAALTVRGNANGLFGECSSV